MRDQPVRREDLRGYLQGSSQKAAMISGQSKVTSRIGITLDLEFNPIPLKYVDVTRTTYISLDILQEIRFNDYWNVDVDRTSSDSWTGFMKFTLLTEKPPPGYMWSGGRRTKIETTTRLDLFVS